MDAKTVAAHQPLPDAHEAEKDKEIASAGTALFLAAFTIVVGSFSAALLTYMLHLRF